MMPLPPDAEQAGENPGDHTAGHDQYQPGELAEGTPKSINCSASFA